MWEERDVYTIIDQRVQEWLRTLQMVQVRVNVSPAEFMYDLTEFLFPQTFETCSTDIARLQFVKKVFKEHGIAQGEHWRPVLTLCQAENPETEHEGLDAFNNLLRGLKHFFTPEQDYRKILWRKLDERRLACEDLLRDLEELAGENEFYSDKMQRIQDLIASQSSSVDAITARRVLEESTGVKRTKTRAVTQVPTRA